MTKVLRGLGGATTVTANTSEAILEATAELLSALRDANGFDAGRRRERDLHVVSLIPHRR